MLALHVLGGLRASLEGRELTGLAAQRSRAALLVFLGLEREVTRESVVAVFWPDHEPTKARHALSQTIHRLRRSFGDGCVRADGERLCAGPAVEVDAVRFAEMVDSGAYESAVAIYRGQFLNGWYLGDSSAFERWTDQQRARLERLHRIARREAIRARREAGDLPTALRLAQEWAELDPLEDEAQHRLIELLGESGRRADALGQYELYAGLLREEELTPLEETVELVARLREAGPEAGSMNGRSLAATSPIEGAADAALAAEPNRARLPDPPGAPLLHRVRTRLTRTFWMVAAGVVVVAGWMALALSARTGNRDPAAAHGVRFVLADFANDTRDSLIAGVVTEALRIDLERHLHSALMDPAEVASVRARMLHDRPGDLRGDTAREVALRAGATAVIDGRVGGVGPGFVLSAWLIAAEDGRVLDAALATAADSTGLIAAIEELSGNLLRMLTPASAAMTAATPLPTVTTPSLDALRLYAVASRVWRIDGDGARAIRYLGQATRLDTTFAMAYGLLAAVHMSVSDDRQASIEALQRAYRHREHLTDMERYLTVASYHQSATGNLEVATEAYEDALAIDSLNVVGLNNLGVLYRDERDFARAEEMLRRCTRADSLAQTCSINLAGVVHARGRSEESWAILDTLCRRFPTNPFVRSQPGWTAAAEGAFDRADTLFAALALLQLPNPGRLQNWLGYVDMVRGHVHEARMHFREAYRISRESEPTTAIAALLAPAWMELEIGRDTAAAAARVDEALADPVLAGQGPLNFPYLALADLYVAMGRLDQAERMLERFLADVPVELRRPMDRDLYALRGHLAMEQGRLEEAGQAFRAADGYSGSPFVVLRYLGPLYEREGRPDSAIVAYERYLSAGTTDRLIWDAFLLPGVLEHLAALHEAAGHLREAAAYRAQFADLWAGADPELLPRVEAARRGTPVTER